MDPNNGSVKAKQDIKPMGRFRKCALCVGRSEKALFGVLIACGMDIPNITPFCVCPSVLPVKGKVFGLLYGLY